MIDKDSNIGTVLYIILGIILAFGVNQGLSIALQTDMPIVAVESNSMVPTFNKGDILVLQGTESPKEADIIVFSVPDRSTPIVHRIVDINPDGTYQTKGDANFGQLPFEKRVTKEQIHGKVISIIPYIGWVKIGLSEIFFNYIMPNYLWVILIVIVAVALFISFFGSDDYYVKREKEHKFRYKPKRK